MNEFREKKSCSPTAFAFLPFLLKKKCVCQMCCIQIRLEKEVLAIRMTPTLLSFIWFSIQNKLLN